MNRLQKFFSRASIALIIAILTTACTMNSQSAGANTGDAEIYLPVVATAQSTEGSTENPAIEPVVETEGTAERLRTLASQFNQPSETNGDLFILHGQVTNKGGAPILDTVVEIWQTDMNGVYDHPRDPTTAERDQTFQFFGTAAVDANGNYLFRTILPGLYEPRPRHIHFKIKQNGATLLTSQLYFSDGAIVVDEEGVISEMDTDNDPLTLQLLSVDDLLFANGFIIIDVGSGADDYAVTPSQQEGPYYPVVSVADYDNDLAAR